jgi:uncharacterized membrane protein
MGIYLALHVLSVVVWVGGMFFAWMVLRPVAAEQLEPPLRLQLWRSVFERFFPWVWLGIALILFSGSMMIIETGGLAATTTAVRGMITLGGVMMLIFLHVYFAPFRRIRRHLDAGDIPAAGKQLASIRRLVGTNSLIGLVTLVVATAGKYYLA